jgi:hypothetical protein
VPSGQQRIQVMKACRAAVGKPPFVPSTSPQAGSPGHTVSF